MRSIGGVFLPNTIQPGEYSMGGGTDDTSYMVLCGGIAIATATWRISTTGTTSAG